MFTYKQKKKAINLYFKYNEHIAPVIRKLGYPNKSSLRNWVIEYKKNGSITEKYERKKRFTKEEINKAINYYFEHGENMSDTVKKLGYPSRYTLEKWLIKYSKKYKPKKKKPSISSYTDPEKLNAAVKMCTHSDNVDAIADEYGLTRAGLCQWKNRFVGKGSEHSMTKKKIRELDKETQSECRQQLLDEIAVLKVQAATLKKDIVELQMEKDILEKAAELIKKDDGISIESLTNKEKTIIIDALRENYPLSKLLKSLKLSKSSYFYDKTILSKEEKYKEVRLRIKTIFNDNKCVYGYRRINIELRKQSIKVSEKIIRRIMKQDDLTVYHPKMKKYSSYKGEISPEVDNLLKRDFHSDSPFEKLLTDLTEFSILAGKYAFQQ